MKDTDLARTQFQFYDKTVLRYRYFFIFLYIVVIPFFRTPHWCLKESDRMEFFTDCKKYGIPYSETTTINTTYLVIFDMMCVCYFTFGRFYRRKFDAEYEPHEKREDGIFVVAVIATIISLIVSIV